MYLELSSCFLQIFDALEHLHNLNIVHRDLKLENIMIGPNNEILLVDFGAAAMMKPKTSDSAESLKLYNEYCKI